jgi:hypothetical protein
LKYYIAEYVTQPSDHDLIDIADDDNCGHDHETAENAAENHFSHHDGWESSWPLTFVLVEDDGSTSSWVVELESVPQFYARRKKT